MLAVLFGLQSLIPAHINNITLKLNIDNTTVVNILRNMGSSHNTLLNKFNRDIWLWAKTRSMWLVPVYISSSSNLADKSSREISVDAEWKLCSSVFHTIINQLHFLPDIDLFATRHNFQIPKFVSFRPDPPGL